MDQQRAGRRPLPRHAARRRLRTAWVAVVLAVVAANQPPSPPPSQASAAYLPAGPILTVNTDPINSHEFLPQMGTNQAQVFQYFYDHYGVQDSATFWTTPHGVVTPLTIDQAVHHAAVGATHRATGDGPCPRPGAGHLLWGNAGQHAAREPELSHRRGSAPTGVWSHVLYRSNLLQLRHQQPGGKPQAEFGRGDAAARDCGAGTALRAVAQSGRCLLIPEPGWHRPVAGDFAVLR